VPGHQAPQGGAVGTPVVLLDALGFLRPDIEQAADVLADALVGLRAEIAARRLQRVVEVEQPDVAVASHQFPVPADDEARTV
jgi:hypothetical protein